MGKWQTEVVPQHGSMANREKAQPYKVVTKTREGVHYFWRRIYQLSLAEQEVEPAVGFISQHTDWLIRYTKPAHYLQFALPQALRQLVGLFIGTDDMVVLILIFWVDQNVTINQDPINGTVDTDNEE